MVTATKPKTRMTADELLAMPDDGYRYELVRGELRKKPLRGWRDGLISGNLRYSLGRYVEDNGLGVAVGCGYLLAPDHVRAPATAFVRKERAPDPMTTPGYFPGPPDVAIDVVSLGDTLPEIAEKVQDWLDAGTRAAVVVNPRNRTVQIHRLDMETVHLTEDDVLEIPDIILGWRMPIREIFR